MKVMNPGDLVQVQLPFMKGWGVLVGHPKPLLPRSKMKKYEITNDYRWTVLYEGILLEFHQSNLKATS